MCLCEHRNECCIRCLFLITVFQCPVNLWPCCRSLILVSKTANAFCCYFLSFSFFFIWVSVWGCWYWLSVCFSKFLCDFILIYLLKFILFFVVFLVFILTLIYFYCILFCWYVLEIKSKWNYFNRLYFPFLFRSFILQK